MQAREAAERKLKAQQEQERKQRLAKQQQQERAAKAAERQALEAQALREQAERERLEQVAAAERAAAKADADYASRIAAKIRGNIVMPPGVPGNPEVVFAVVQLPSGEVIDVELEKSSGFKPYDEAVERAILKSSPLPKPERPESFRRSLNLRFRPTE